MWGGLYTAVCTCAHRVHSAEQVFGDTDGETDGLCCRCGRPGLLRAQEGQSKIFEEENVWGVEEHAATFHLGHCCFNTSSFTRTLQLFVAGLSVGSAPVLFIGRGRHGRIRHQPDLTWVCWWRQVTEEEVHLCRVAAVGHHLYFFYCLGDVGEGSMAVEDSVLRILQC